MRKRDLGDISGPVWNKIDEPTRQALQKFQRRKYHTSLNPPPEPSGVKVDLVVTEQDIRDMSLTANDHRLRGDNDG